MKPQTANDVEALARGRAVGSDAFRAVFADAEALSRLARSLEVADLVRPLDDELSPAGPPAELEFSFEELSRFGEDKLRDPKRREAIARFLEAHGLLQPGKDSPPPGEVGTVFGTAAGAADETHTDTVPLSDQTLPPEKPPEQT